MNFLGFEKGGFFLLKTFNYIILNFFEKNYLITKTSKRVDIKMSFMIRSNHLKHEEMTFHY